MFEKTTSLVTDQTYVVCQFKVAGPTRIHFQVAGPNFNREYGAAADATVPADFIDWAAQLPRTVKSMASSTHYIPAQGRVVYLEDENTGTTAPYFHLQIEGPEYNRPYGAAINLRISEELAAYLDE